MNQPEKAAGGVLSDAEVHDLVRRARAGDAAARARLVEANLRLVHSLVGRFGASGYELDDLFQVGCIGLVKAVDRFDPAFGVRFSTYAVPLILGEIRRFLRDDGPLRLSRHLKTLATAARRMRETLTARWGREPTVAEVAAALAADPAEITEALDGTRPPASFHQTVHEGEGDPIYLVDQIADQEGREGLAVDRVLLRQCLDQLEPRQRAIIILRYFRDRTQAETAAVIGISQVQVSRLERRALALIRRHAGAWENA